MIFIFVIIQMPVSNIHSLSLIHTDDVTSIFQQRASIKMYPEYIIRI